MTDRWLMLLGPWCIWAAHFALIWTAASIFGTSTVAKATTAGLTAVGLALLGFAAVRIPKLLSSDPVDGWLRTLGYLSCAVAALAILWQTVPALLL